MRYRYIVYSNNKTGEVIACSPENESETLENFALNADKTAPDGFEREVTYKPFVWIQREGLDKRSKMT